MTAILSLRFCGPMASYSAPKIDSRYPTGPVPAISQIAGMFGNALGYVRTDFDRLEALQADIHIIGTICLQFGTWGTDFHTTDLSPDHMVSGWTTRGEPEGRGQGAACRGTHPTRRAYWADLDDVILIRVGDDQRVAQIVGALHMPARPLFLGRAAFMPSLPIFAGTSPDVDDKSAMSLAIDRHQDAVGIFWEGERPDGWYDAPDGTVWPTLGPRDWRNDITSHGGTRRVRQYLRIPPALGGYRQIGCFPRDL